MLVIDMQNYFVQSFGAITVPGINRLKDWCKLEKIPVIYTQHIHRKPEEDGGMLKEWWNSLLIHGTHETELHSDIKPGDSRFILIEKNRYSAFFNTELDNVLKKLEIKDIIITGVMTNLCCETTARDAFVRDYRIFFVADATATVNYDLHFSSLKNLAFGFAEIVCVKDLVTI
jgi:isochorismate hydrolase